MSLALTVAIIAPARVGEVTPPEEQVLGTGDGGTLGTGDGGELGIGN